MEIRSQEERLASSVEVLRARKTFVLLLRSWDLDGETDGFGYGRTGH